MEVFVCFLVYNALHAEIRCAVFLSLVVVVAAATVFPAERTELLSVVSCTSNTLAGAQTSRFL